ncbi:MAG: radical SAM protein [Candidatus Brocadiia bacterium]
MMKVISEQGRPELAMVYIGRMRDGSDKHLVEFVESVQPPIPRQSKWVIIVSSQFGCPIGCLMCDAGRKFSGNLTADEILAQIDYLVTKYYPSGAVPVPKFKIQFARMGEPALNPAVLDVLEQLPKRYKAEGLMPCVATVAPQGSDEFFERLIDIKNRLYSGDRFQLQFSINTTDPAKRQELMPHPKWTLAQIAQYGRRFHRPGDRKMTLNFAVAEGYPVDADIIRQHFSPEQFLIKITPLNPTRQVASNKLETYIQPNSIGQNNQLVSRFKKLGYDTILSIGEQEENQIGSNCGEFVSVLQDKSALTAPM